MAAMCRYMGCVSQAMPHSETCAVHASSQGKACSRCLGSGSKNQLDDATQKYTKGACDLCGGTGLKDAHKGAPRAIQQPVAPDLLSDL